ncbi:MAG: hypothetical protein ACRD04_13365 [Terriglobales bacterium]
MFLAQYSTLLRRMLPLLLLVASPAQGFFRLQPVAGGWLLLNPAGTSVQLRALNHVQLVPASGVPLDLSPAYVLRRTAALNAAIRQDGFNAIGADSDAALWQRGLPYVESLQLSRQLASQQQNPAVNVYAPDFAATVAVLVRVAVRPRRHDHRLIGYLSDDGLPWAPNRNPELLLASYLALPWSARASGGREHAVDYLRLRYGNDIAALRRAWHTDASDFTSASAPQLPNPAFAADAAGFSAQVLARYLSVVARALHRQDPNHLFLGANLQFRPAGKLGSIWSIAAVASVRLAPGANVAQVVAALAQRTARPLWLELEGCRTVPPPDLAAALANPRVIGFSWTPQADWRYGACAVAASRLASIR